MDNNLRREVLLSEFIVWAGICRDKHGYVPPSDDQLRQLTEIELNQLLKDLKNMARTPHEG